MELQQLKYFLCASRTASFADVADEFGVSRQAISSSIKSLESELKIVLFDRSRNRLALTPEANDILLKVMKLDDSMKANTTINKVLETCYNPETKTFKQEIPVKDVSSNINYSVQISKKHRDALAKEAKKRNMTVGEYLSELVLRTIKFN